MSAAAAPHPAAAVRAAGKPLALTDGTIVLVRFGFGELMDIEARFGSITLYADNLDTHVGGPIFTTVAVTVAIMLKRPVDAVAPLLDPHAVASYAATILEAFGEAMPAARPKAVEDPKAQPSDGPSSSTSPPSDGAAASPISGG